MIERRKHPRPDRLFVDSKVSGDVETITVSTQPGDLGPPEVLGQLMPAEELQRDPDEGRPWPFDPWSGFSASLAVVCVLLATFGAEWFS